MNASLIKKARKSSGITQIQLARRLNKTQGYVSLLERGERTPSPDVTKKLLRILDIQPTSKPLSVKNMHELSADAQEERIARSLSTLGYLWFAHEKPFRDTPNPATVILETLACAVVPVRPLEALPWLLLNYSEFHLKETAESAYALRIQNRLGFVVALALEVADRKPEYAQRYPELKELLAKLEPMRLAKADTLGYEYKSTRLKAQIILDSTAYAKHWNIVTDLKAEHLPYGE